MKIQSLNAKDFECIERAFSYTMGEQLLRAREKAQSGNIGGCEIWLALLAIIQYDILIIVKGN